MEKLNSQLPLPSLEWGGTTRAGAGESTFRHVEDDVSRTRGLWLTSARGYIKVRSPQHASEPNQRWSKIINYLKLPTQLPTQWKTYGTYSSLKPSAQPWTQ